MPAIDVTDTSFEQDVLDRSEVVPMIIDLWAPWCGPCRSLGPIIERVVEDADGAAELAKVNVDENPRVSASFQVQSIPAVFAIHRRQVVDRFIGALPEEQVRQFVDRVVAATKPSETERLIEAGDEDSLRKALELEPANEEAIAALSSLLVERGSPAGNEEALSLLARVPETAETRRIAALARTGGGASAIAPSESGGAGGDDELAFHIEELLSRLPRDEAARQEIVDLLETLEEDDPRRSSYRRALAAKLF